MKNVVRCADAAASDDHLECEEGVWRCEQEIVDWGYKFHMNDISACIGLENLRNMQLRKKLLC